jgi:hypothetical protein
MIELRYQLACPEHSRKRAKYILELIASLAGIRLVPESTNFDIIYGDSNRSQALSIPAQNIAIDNRWHEVPSENQSLLLPDSIGGPLFDEGRARFNFDIIAVMGAYLETKLASHNRLDNSSLDFSELSRARMYDYVRYFILTLQKAGKLPDNFKPTSPWPNNSSFGLGVSHDIDILRRKIPGSLLMLVNACGLGEYHGGIGGAVNGLIDSVGSRLIGKQNPYCRFDRISGKEWQSTIFAYSGTRKSSKDPTYELPQLFSELKPYRDNFEIAFHSGIGTWNSPIELTQAKRKLVQYSGKPIRGIRPHYLDCRFPDFWSNLDGYDYSSSLGSDSIPGFAFGLNFPLWGFKLPGWEKLNIVEMPISLMDCALFRITDRRRRFDFIDGLIETCIANRCMMVIDWHNTSFYDTDFPGWFEAYEYIIKKAIDKGAFIGPLDKINSIWRTHCESAFLS